MSDAPTWQIQSIDQLSRLFERDPDARALILCGSLAAPGDQADSWSDVDAKVILAGPAVERYFHSLDWLAPFGRLVGAERNESQRAKTLRVCLEGFRRFDLTFIAESDLRTPAVWDQPPFQPPYRVLWSRLPDLEPQIAALPLPPEYQVTTDEEIERMVDGFWFKASAAVAKVMRNDLLVGMHLALDLAQDCLILQMIRRDRQSRTSIHRTGGWGNEITARFTLIGQEDSGEAILDLIRLNCEVFDPLAADLLSGCQPRGPLLYPAIDAAKQALALASPAPPPAPVA